MMYGPPIFASPVETLVVEGELFFEQQWELVAQQQRLVHEQRLLEEQRLLRQQQQQQIRSAQPLQQPMPLRTAAGYGVPGPAPIPTSTLRINEYRNPRQLQWQQDQAMHRIHQEQRILEQERFMEQQMMIREERVLENEMLYDDIVLRDELILAEDPPVFGFDLAWY